jgi:predicted Zn-dependent protease
VFRGKKTGIATINELDDAALERAVRRAEELADLSPENDEFMPTVDKQAYKASKTFSEATAALTPQTRAEVAAASILPCAATASPPPAILEDNTGFTAFANSNGNFAYQTTTDVSYNCTVRTDDGTGSGWVQRNHGDVGEFKAADAVAVAIDKAKRSVEPRALEPGKYTVILEPEAVSGLLTFMLFTGFDARQADEGRNFMARRAAAPAIGRAGLRQAGEPLHRPLGGRRRGAALGRRGPGPRALRHHQGRQGRAPAALALLGQAARTSRRAPSPAT